MEEKRAYIRFTYFLQAVLYLPYLWFCMVSLVASQALRELQRNPEPANTPFYYLLFSITSFAIIIALIVMFLLFTKRLKVMTKPLLLINIVLPCIVVSLRFLFSSVWLFGVSGELIYSFYINLNEVAFLALNILVVVISICFLKSINQSSRSV